MSIVCSIPFFGKLFGAAPDCSYKRTDCVQDSKDYERHQALINTAKTCEHLFQTVAQENLQKKVTNFSQKLKSMLLSNATQLNDLELFQDEVHVVHGICQKQPLFRRQFLADLEDVEFSIKDFDAEQRKLILNACWIFAGT